MWQLSRPIDIPTNDALLSVRNFFMDVSQTPNNNLKLLVKWFHNERNHVEVPSFTKIFSRNRWVTRRETPPHPVLLCDTYTAITSRLVYETDNKPADTHDAADNTEQYLEWRVFAELRDGAKVADETLDADHLQLLSQTLIGAQTIWTPVRGKFWLRVEADVAERLVTDAFKVCASAINGYLEAWYQWKGNGDTPPVVEYDSNYYRKAPDVDDDSSEALASYFDHVFFIKGKTRALNKFLVIIEVKKPKTVKPNQFAQFEKEDGLLVKHGSRNNNRFLRQLLKYVQTSECSRTVLVDGMCFLGMEWSTPPELGQKYPGEKKKFSYWDMQRKDEKEEGPPFLLSMLHMLVRAVRDAGYMKV